MRRRLLDNQDVREMFYILGLKKVSKRIGLKSVEEARSYIDRYRLPSIEIAMRFRDIYGVDISYWSLPRHDAFKVVTEFRNFNEVAVDFHPLLDSSQVHDKHVINMDNYKDLYDNAPNRPCQLFILRCAFKEFAKPQRGEFNQHNWNRILYSIYDIKNGSRKFLGYVCFNSAFTRYVTYSNVKSKRSKTIIDYLARRIWAFLDRDENFY